MEKRQNIVVPLPDTDPVVGRWLWALQDARERTFEELVGVTEELVDWRPDDKRTSIGSILYHTAAIELDWLYEEVLVKPFPEDLIKLFPHPIRDETGQLGHVSGERLETHLQRLAAVRAQLLAVYQEMDLEDFRRVRSLPDYDVTPEWVLHHLLQHEAEHRSEIGQIRNRFRLSNA